jgi:hypothetical protein
MTRLWLRLMRQPKPYPTVDPAHHTVHVIVVVVVAGQDGIAKTENCFGGAKKENCFSRQRHHTSQNCCNRKLFPCLPCQNEKLFPTARVPKRKPVLGSRYCNRDQLADPPRRCGEQQSLACTGTTNATTTSQPASVSRPTDITQPMPPRLPSRRTHTTSLTNHRYHRPLCRTDL